MHAERATPTVASIGYEALSLARRRKNRSEHLDPVVAQYGGRLVKVTGDRALVEFGSAVDALSAAIEIQLAMADANDDRQPTQRRQRRRPPEGEPPTGGIVILRTVHAADAILPFQNMSAILSRNTLPMRWRRTP